MNRVLNLIFDINLLEHLDILMENPPIFTIKTLQL